MHTHLFNGFLISGCSRKHQKYMKMRKKNETQERDSNYIANNEKKWNNNHKINYYVAFRAVKIYWIILKANCN